MISEKPIDFDRFIRWVIAAGVLVLAFILLNRLSAVLLPFLLAWLTAYLLNPMVAFVQRFIKNRAASVGLVLFVIALTSVVLMVLLLPVIAAELKHMYLLIDSQLNSMQWPTWLPKDIVDQGQAYLATIDYGNLLKQEGVSDKLFTALNGIWKAVSGVYGIVGALFGVVTYVLYLIFIMIDYGSISSGWMGLVPTKHRDFFNGLAKDLESGMNGYFRAQTKIVLTVAVLFAFGFWLIGLPFAIVLGLAVGLLNYVPYLQLVGMVPALALAALNAVDNGASIWLALILVVVIFTVIQLIQDVFLTPRFMGNFSGLNPAIILLSLSVWGSLLGLVGLIIAIPLTVVMLSYYRRYILKEGAD